MTLAEISAYLEQDWARALLVFLIALVITVLVRLFIRKVLWRMVGNTKTELDDRFLEIFQFPVSFSIMAGGLWQSLGFFQDDMPENLFHLIYAILMTLTILIWMGAFLKFSNVLVEILATENRFSLVRNQTKPLFRMFFKIVVMIAGVYFLIVAWGQDVTGWLASAGVAGIAIGFAAKDTLANFISGLFIIADSPYKIGDYIVLGNGDRGRVVDIGLRSTRLLTRDDVEIIIPNAIIGNTEVINQSGGPYEKFRVRIKIGVAYGSDVDLVREILVRVAVDEPLIMDEPRPRLRFREFGEFSLNYELLTWVEEPGARGLAMDRMLTTIYKEFGKNHIEIPYPKRDLYLHQVKTNEGSTNNGADF